MIEDFDGPDPAPSRRGHLLVISALLLVGVIAGYAAVSSPELRGPYATPRPSVVNAPRLMPAPVASLEPSSNTTLGWSVVCAAPEAPGPVWIFVNAPVAVVTSPSGQKLTVDLRSSASNACPALIWWPAPGPLPLGLSR